MRPNVKHSPEVDYLPITVYPKVFLFSFYMAIFANNIYTLKI